jgi:hypothetical protein
MSTEVRERCPQCGGLVSSVAEWCGQCYAPLTPPAPGEAVDAHAEPAAPEAIDAHAELAAPEALPVPSVDVEPPPGAEPGPRRPGWHCPGCGERNDLEHDPCPICGTPFARLFEEPERGPVLDARAATMSSLVFPGVGHFRLGRPAEGLARAVLFVWALATAVLLFRAHNAPPVMTPLAALFAAAAAAMYALTALDAGRAADGHSQLLGSKVLLYATMGLLGLSFASFILMASQATAGLR